MSMTDRDRRAIRWGAITLGGLALAQFIVLPWLGHWRETRQRIAAAQVELAELELQVSRVLGQRSRLDRVLGPGSGKPLPTVGEAQVRAVKAAEQTLQAGGVGVTSVRPQPVRPLRELPGIALVTLQVEGQGMFAQLPQCLASLRNSEQLLLVEKLTLGPSPQRPGMMTITLGLAAPAREEDAR